MCDCWEIARVVPKLGRKGRKKYKLHEERVADAAFSRCLNFQIQHTLALVDEYPMRAPERRRTQAIKPGQLNVDPREVPATEFIVARFTLSVRPGCNRICCVLLGCYPE